MGNSAGQISTTLDVPAGSGGRGLFFRPPRRRLHSDVERVDIGDQTILTRDGRLHLAISSAEAEVLDELTAAGSLKPDQASHQGRMGSDDIDGLVRELGQAGFLEGTETPVDARFVISTAGIECDGFDRVVSTIYRLAGRRLFNPLAVGLLGVVVVVGATATVAVAFSTVTAQPADEAAALAALIVFGWFTTAVHETAHAIVIHHGGRKVGRAGVGFYWGSLGFFVDATDALFLPRRLRAVQAGAGPAADAVLAALLGIIAWCAVGTELGNVLVLVAVLAWLEVAFNLVPFLKLDGYWMLADWLDRPDLSERSWLALRESIRRPFGSNQRGLAGYAIASGTFGMLMLFAAIGSWVTTFGPTVSDALQGGTLERVLAAAFLFPVIAGAVVTVGQAVVRFAPRSSSGDHSAAQPDGRR